MLRCRRGPRFARPGRRCGYLPQLGDAFADFDWSNQSAEDVAYMEMEWADQLNKIDEMTREAIAQLDAWRTANV